jgi:acyl carrier protein
MVPGVFVALDALPLNPNGKVDRGALPEPDGDRLAADHERVPPRNPTERGIAEIWSEVLGLDEIGIHDAFFDLGGHSLLASKVMARVRSRYSVELPLGVMFERPTVAELASAVLESRAAERGEDRVASLLDRLKDLSDEEAEALLAQAEPTSGERG